VGAAETATKAKTSTPVLQADRRTPASLFAVEKLLLLFFELGFGQQALVLQLTETLDQVQAGVLGCLVIVGQLLHRVADSAPSRRRCLFGPPQQLLGPV